MRKTMLCLNLTHALVKANRIALITMAIMLGGCASLGTSTVVKVPVPVPCVASIPPMPERDQISTTDIYDATRSLLINDQRNQSHIAELRAMLVACQTFH